MSDQVQDAEAAAAPSRGVWSWLGTGVLACLGGALACVAWLSALGLLMMMCPECTDPTDPVPASLKPGVTIGLALAGTQLLRAITQAESQLLSTLAITLIAAVVSTLSPWVSTTLSHHAGVAYFILLLFSLAHVGAFSFIHIWRWLGSLRVPGIASLLSAMALTPVCGGFVVTDEVAQLSEPAGELDGEDVVAGIFTATRNLCFLEVNEWRGEAVRMAQGSGLAREDAEDVVGSVMLSVCTTEGYRQDLRPYFFAAVKKRTADPWRRSARRTRIGDAWGAEPRLPAPTPEAILAETNGCLGQAMRALPDDERSVVVLTVIRGFTLDEAVTHLGRSRSALDRSKHRGLERLRKTCFH